MRSLLLFVCSVGLLSVRAASPAPEHTFRILNLAGELIGLNADGTQHGAMLYFDTPDSRRVLVPVPFGKFPRARPIPPGGKLALYRFELAPADTPLESVMPCCRAAVAAGKPKKTWIATATIPPGQDRSLVILTAAANGRIQASVVDDSLGLRGRDTILAFNALARPAALSLGKHTLEIPARNALAGPFVGDDGAIPVKLGLRTDDGGWRLALNTVYSARPGYRVLAVIRNPAGTDSGATPILSLDYEYIGLKPEPSRVASR